MIAAGFVSSDLLALAVPLNTALLIVLAMIERGRHRTTRRVEEQVEQVAEVVNTRIAGGRRASDPPAGGEHE